MEMELQLESQTTNKDYYLKKYFDRWLRVYVDEVKDKYYIDTFAAYSLNIIDYKVACTLSDRGSVLFEITKETLEYLKEIFKDRITYVSISSQYVEKPNLKENNDNNDNNYLGYDINESYKIYKEDNYMGDFESYLIENKLIDKEDYNNFKL